jgi:nicotinamide mononucleotide (NMN) deamidase PncC
VASATAPSCSAGIASMRIYTAPGVAAYTVNSGSIDTYLTMANGNYNTVIQAWDNCGNVYKTPVSITVE